MAPHSSPPQDAAQPPAFLQELPDAGTTASADVPARARSITNKALTDVTSRFCRFFMKRSSRRPSASKRWNSQT